MTNVALWTIVGLLTIIVLQLWGLADKEARKRFGLAMFTLVELGVTALAIAGGLLWSAKNTDRQISNALIGFVCFIGWLVVEGQVLLRLEGRIGKR